MMLLREMLVPQVIIDQPERMNLLGLLLGAVIERNLATPEGARALRGLSGVVLVTAGSMRAALELGADGLRIAREPTAKPTAELHGSLSILARVALNDSLLGMVAPLLCGDLIARGNPLTLLRLRPLLRPPP